MSNVCKSTLNFVTRVQMPSSNTEVLYCHRCHTASGILRHWFHIPPEHQVTEDPTPLELQSIWWKKWMCHAVPAQAISINRQGPVGHAYSSQDGFDDLLTAGDAPEQRAGCCPHLCAILGLLQELLLRFVQLLAKSQFLLKSKQNQKNE